MKTKIEGREAMQLGVSLDEHEIKDLIKARVSRETNVPEIDLQVHVTSWNGRLSTVVIRGDGEDLTIAKGGV